MKFTKEEISLCKQVAERHRKEIGYGDWYLDNKVVLLNNNFVKGTIHVAKQVRLRLTPLWTIPDCLEFLEQHRYYWTIEVDDEEFGSFNCLLEPKWMSVVGQEEYEGKTPLEACLKAVLAVFEEEK